MKKQLKKGLSLFLTVVMLMTCWVWVAPEKASAVSAGTYHVLVQVNVTDSWDNGGSNATCTVNYKDQNGTGSAGSSAQTAAEYAYSNTGKLKIFEADLAGFPTSVSFWYKCSFGRNVTFNEVTIFVNGTPLTHDMTGSYTAEGAWTGTKETTFNATVSQTDYPKPAEIEGFGVDLSVDVPRIDDPMAVVTKGPFTPIVKDQYGTTWKTAPNVFFASNENAATDTFGEAEGLQLTQSGDSYSLLVDNRVQNSLPVTNGDSYKEIYIRAYLSENNGIAQATKKLTLNYPKYTWYFDGVGAAANTPRAQITLSDGTTTENDYTVALTYSTKLTPYPTGE
ncbi:MAG: hypothetical protein PUC33_08595, partial [Oscillospiraceae bacterium]|nr:hypothetical protein [Oscillospiraceae bacterium]